jgi:hypothetical protein
MGSVIMYILSFFVLSVISCSADLKNDCNKLKIGQFYYINKKTGIQYTVKRNDSIQTEINGKTGEIKIKKIKWIESCMYELQSPSKMSDDSTDPNRKIVIESLPAKVSILNYSKDYYVFNSSSGLDKTGYNDTMWIVYLLGGFKSIGSDLKK